MTYSIEIKPRAKDDLKKLNTQTVRQIKNKLETIKESPEHYLKWIDKYKVYRLRVGKYRVFIDLNVSKKIIDVLVVRHRNKAYKGWRT